MCLCRGEHQLVGLRTLLPAALKPGGSYVIERVETSYWRAGVPLDIGNATTGGADVVHKLKQVAERTNRLFHGGSGGGGGGAAEPSSEPSSSSWAEEVESVTFSHNAAVVTKRLAGDDAYDRREYDAWHVTKAHAAATG